MSKLTFALAGGLNVEYMLTSMSPSGVFKSLIDSAKRMEALGFDHYLLGEHQCEDPSTSIWTSPAVWMAVIAQHTTTLRLMPAVFVLPFHNPFRLAQDAAWVDQVSEGRLECGVGLGSVEHQYVRLNLPFAERRSMALEAMEVILKSWTQECFTHHGEYYHYDEALPWPPPFQKPHPPVWWAASSPDSIKYAAKMNFNFSQLLLDKASAEGHKRWEEEWKAQGHEGPLPHSMILRTVYVAETDKEALEDAKEAFERARKRRGVDVSRVARTKIGPMIRDAATLPSPAEADRRRAAEDFSYGLEGGRWVVGCPETVARRIKEQQDLIGFDTYAVFLRMNLPSEKIERSFRLFGEKVIPLLK